MNMSRSRIGVLASGGGSNLGALLAHFATAPASTHGAVQLVLSDRADAGALERARALGISALSIADPRDGVALRDLLQEHQIDLIVLAGYLKLVPAEVVATWPGRMLNVHPAMLPAFGGPGMYGKRVHAAVIAAGVDSSGVTVHFVDEQYDRGAVAAQQAVPVLPDDTPETLAARVLQAEHALLPRVVAAVAAGQIALTPDGRVTGQLPSLPF